MFLFLPASPTFPFSPLFLSLPSLPVSLPHFISVFWLSILLPTRRRRDSHGGAGGRSRWAFSGERCKLQTDSLLLKSTVSPTWTNRLPAKTNNDSYFRREGWISHVYLPSRLHKPFILPGTGKCAQISVCLFILPIIYRRKWHFCQQTPGTEATRG